MFFLLLLWYIHKKDVDEEPKGLLGKIFGFGCLSVIPIVIVELVLQPFFSTENTISYLNMFINTFIGVALIEELGKWVVTYLCGYKSSEFDHPYDAIVYAVFASLGFALVENVLYVLTAGEDAFMTAILRAILSVPSHACDGVIMGFFLGFAKMADIKGESNNKLTYLLLSLFIPVVTHTIYDSVLFQFANTENMMYFGIFILFVIIQYIVCVILIRKTSKIKTNFDGSEAKKETVGAIVSQVINKSFCPNCGTKIEVRFCPNCGYDRNK